jgi:ABC-type uncharacterized transport system permease subunit
LQESSILWLRVAALLYLPGLLVALFSFLRGNAGNIRSNVSRGAMVAFLMGATVHLVAVVEEALEVGQFPAHNFFEAITLLGLLLAVTLLVCQVLYRFDGLAILLMPLVFLMTLTGSVAGANPAWNLGTGRDAWLITHVVFIMVGYAALVVTASASLFYLWRERQLKQKHLPGAGDAVPPLMTLDSIVAKAGGVGFAFLTAGLVMGIIWASNESGIRWIREQRILVAIGTWLIYLALVYLRVASGWRGRKAAYLALAALGGCIVTWVTHSGVASVLKQ